MIKFAIAHAAFDPERAAPLRRLESQLSAQSAREVYTFPSRVREHSRVWARRIWSWIAGQPEDTRVVVLNDDVTVPGDFVHACGALVTACPDELISLHVQGDAAKALAVNGARWARIYCYTGPGVILSPAIARALVAFGDHPGRWDDKDTNEDNIASQWLYAMQRPAWACIPSLVKHDTGVPSTLGYDWMPLRTSVVAWDDPIFATDDRSLAVDHTSWPADLPRWIENPWFHTGDLEHRRRRDAGLLVAHPVLPRITVATPRRYGDWCPEYDDMIRALMRSDKFEILGVSFPEDDITRARARLVAFVLANPLTTHVLFLDADNFVGTDVIGAMFRADRDVVCCPYPKKRTSVKVNDLTFPASIEETIKRHTIRTLPGFDAARGIELDAHKCWEIASMGLGCCLVKRSALEAMAEAYGPTDTIFDEYAPGRSMVDMFDLLRSPLLSNGDQVVTVAGHHVQEKLSEDHSFFERWRTIGGHVWAYMGPGAPAKHHGRTTFESSLAAFGLPT